MKHIYSLIICCLLLAGCLQSGNEGFVEFDGPILESVSSEGNLEFNGVVINSGDEPVDSVFIVIILKDESGNVIEADSTPLFKDGNENMLYPSQREFFSLTLKSDPERVFSKEVEIYYNDFGEVSADIPSSPE